MGTAIVHPFDHLLDRDLPTLGAVEAWLARRPPAPGLSWLAFADPDGAVGLVPDGPAGKGCPALLVTEQADGYGVTVCDPDDPEDLGHFATVEDALCGLGCWMAQVAADRGRRRLPLPLKTDIRAYTATETPTCPLTPVTQSRVVPTCSQNALSASSA